MRLFSGPAALLSPGASCSNPPTSGTPHDIWCGVVRPGAASGTIALFAFNLTQAMAGTAVTCAAGDPNCFQLSPSLSNATTAIHGFFGETLIYYDAASVFAWRPGWTGGRVLLALDQLAQCEAAPDAAVVICLKATATSQTTGLINLYAGTIATQTGNPPAMIEAISTTGAIAFSVDSQSVLWSTTASATAPEVLKMQTIGDPTSLRTVATNVTSWRQTPDGGRWLWLSQPTTDGNGFTTGTLQTAPYPAGTSPTNVQAATLDYASYASGSVVTLSMPGLNGADLKVVGNIDTPTTNTMLSTQLAKGILDVTAGGSVLYTDTIALDPTDATGMNQLINLRAVKGDGTGACAVSTTAVADSTSASFNPAATEVAWVRISGTPGAAVIEGMSTPTGSCSTQSYTTALRIYAQTSGGLLLIQNFNMTTLSGALGFAAFGTDGAIGAVTTVDGTANTKIFSLFPATPKVVYSVNQTASTSGIFVSGTLGGTTVDFPGGAAATSPASLGARALLLAPGSRPAAAAAPARALAIGGRPVPAYRRLGTLRSGIRSSRFLNPLSSSLLSGVLSRAGGGR